VIPRFRRGAFVLFALSFVATMLLADLPFGSELLLHPGGVLAGEGLWQPITALFTYPDSMLGAIALSLCIQWFFASRLEEFWGTRRLLIMALVCGVLGYGLTVVVALLVPAAGEVRIGGPGPMDIAIAVAFAVSHGRQTFRPIGDTPISGRILGAVAALLVLAMPLIQVLRGPQPLSLGWGAFVPVGIAGVAALLFVSQPWKRTPKAVSGKNGAKPRDRSHLRVVRNADDLLN
jgi:Na+/melibiose symporter-like transporter